jgi:hypothetical protein
VLGDQSEQADVAFSWVPVFHGGEAKTVRPEASVEVGVVTEF